MTPNEERAAQCAEWIRTQSGKNSFILNYNHLIVYLIHPMESEHAAEIERIKANHGCVRGQRADSTQFCAEVVELQKKLRIAEEALDSAYNHNQNMQCFRTQGTLNKQLNIQTKTLSEARAALREGPPEQKGSSLTPVATGETLIIKGPAKIGRVMIESGGSMEHFYE